MTTDYRNYVQKHPRFTEQAQIKAFGGLGTTYIEDRSGKVIDRLIESVRKGSIVRVYRAFLLAPVRGGTKGRRNRWAARACLIRSAGGRIEAVNQPGKSGARLAMVAYEEIGMSGRGALGQAKQGRPPLEYTPVQMAIIEREWLSRKHETRASALQAIRSYGIDVKLTWLYQHVK